MRSKLLGAAFFAAAACWAQEIDLSSLDRLAAKAKEVNTVNLGKDQLDGLRHFRGDEDEDVPRDLIDKVRSVQIRDFEFAKKGDYTDADLEPVRKQVAALPGCTKIIDSKEDNEHSEIFMCSGNDPKMRGIAIIDAEPRELSVVIVRGVNNLGDLGKLRGLGGLPRVAPVPPPPPPPPPKNH